MPSTRLLLAGVVTAALLLVPSTAAARTYVTGVGADFKLGIKPAAFTAGSGVGGGVLGLDRMRWSSWRARTARGRGRLAYNTCEPTCADGNYEHKRVRVRLFRPRRGCRTYVDGAFVTVRKPLFTKIELRMRGQEPFVSTTSDTQSCQASGATT
jgi:hypothetical protein